MKTLYLILIFLPALINCSPESDLPYSSSKPDTVENNILSCFIKIDTSQGGQSIGCAGSTYKLINKKYVVRIEHNAPVKIDSCYTLIIDSINGKRLTSLLVFDNNDAHLSNLCTDIIIANYPQPSRQLFAQRGEVIIAFSNPAELYGNKTYHTSVLIKKLEFIDSKTGKKIVLENELLWKVLDLGTPG